MMRGVFFIVLAAMVPAAHAGFELYLAGGNSPQAVAGLYDFGKIASGDAVSVQFQLRNASNTAASLTLLTVDGAGFTLASAPSLPMTVNPQAAVNLTVRFTATTPGGYSASLNADGLSVLFTATVVPGLTYEVETAAGKLALGSSGVDFGTVTVGQSATLRFDMENATTGALLVPAVSVSPGDFSLTSPVAGGSALQPGQVANFSVQFQPPAAGFRTGTLSIGGQGFSLTGTGIAPNYPTPQISIDLAHPLSATQGSIRVAFEQPAAVSGNGVVTLAFQPQTASQTDPGVSFASGGLTVAFTFAAGDSAAQFSGQPSAPFQTGTTAGTLTFSAQLGTVANQASVAIAAADVGLTVVQGTRLPDSIQLALTGFDNTHTAGALTFRFYDAAGNLLAPGAITADGTAAFSQYFETSAAGGSFVLRAQFPVGGDPSQIAAFEAALGNSVGVATSARTSF